MKVLVFGNGYVGKQYVASDVFDNIAMSSADITKLSEVKQAVHEHNPDVVINAAGKTNLEWCRDNKIEAELVNIAGPLNILYVCAQSSTTLVQLSSGCIFEGNGVDGEGFTEKDTPSPACFYAETKAASDELLMKTQYGKLLVLRLRQPFGYEPHHRSIITKILHFNKAITSQQSITFIPDLIVATKCLLEKQQFGIYNICNPGTLSPYDIAMMAKETLKHDRDIEPISKQELNALDMSSNREHRVDTVVSTKKLQEAGCVLPSIKDRITDVLQQYSKTESDNLESFAHK